MSPMSPRLLRPRASTGNRYASLRVGLVAYWPLEENASSGNVSAVDWTRRGNDLTSNNTVPSATGQIGTAREFTAANTEWLSAAGANADLKFGDGRDWTFAGWIFVPTWSNSMIFAGNDSTSNREIVFSLVISGGQNRLSCNITPGSAGSGTVTPATNLATNTWHFWAFTYTHATGTLAARINDGIGSNATSSLRGAGSLTQSNLALNLGRRQFTTAEQYFTGRLDEVAKWDRVLTAAELNTLWNAGAGIDLRK